MAVILVLLMEGKYVVQAETVSGGMIYIPGFIKIGEGVEC
jgi:hypothetical protein